MAVLTGQSVIHPQGGIVTLALSPALHGFSVDYWPTHITAASQASIAPRVVSLPVNANGQTHAGYIAPSYLQDYYNRVHLSPTLLALGNLLTSQTRSVQVWNAYLDRPLILTAVAAQNADGITLVGPAALPITFAPLQQLGWQVNININGSSIVDATLTWEFVGGADNVTLTITGNRTIAWTAAPDWSGDGVQEDLEWLTDVMIPWSAVEQRRQLRIAPRRTFTFDLYLNDQTRRVVEAMLFSWSSRVWALPIWPDGQLLTSSIVSGVQAIDVNTTGRDFVAGGLAIILADAVTYELLEIDTIAAGSLQLKQPVVNAWAMGSARVYPLRLAQLPSFPEITRSTDTLSTCSPSFLIVEPCDWPANPGTAVYRTLPVLEWRPNEVMDPKATYNRLITTTDPGTGMFAVDDTAGLGLPSMSHRMLLADLNDRAAYRSMLYFLAGRLSVMWVPTWNQDLLLDASAQTGAQTITVEWTGYTRFLLNQPGRQDIRIELFDGTVRYRRITASIEISSAQEQLALDTPIDLALDPTKIRAISYMTTCRLDIDKVRITHVQDADGYAFSDLSWRADAHAV